MNRRDKKQFKKMRMLGSIFFIAFLLWTAAIKFIGVQAIGPNGSLVGFAPLNAAFHRLTGENWGLYQVTEYLGVIPLCVVAFFGFVGLLQLIQRKSLFKVDKDIIALGVFYVIVIACYILFEKVVINYRPVLIDGVLEASYPSSHTLLALCVLPTAVYQFTARLGDGLVEKIINALLIVVTLCLVFGRLISGVHWFTDIVGGCLLAAALDFFYVAAVKYIKLHS